MVKSEGQTRTSSVHRTTTNNVEVATTSRLPTGKKDGPRVGRKVAGNESEKGGFSGAVCADNRLDGALGYRTGDFGDRLEASEGFIVTRESRKDHVRISVNRRVFEQLNTISPSARQGG